MPTWNAIFKKKGIYLTEPHEDMNSLIKLLKKEKARRILDLGCGTGRHTILLAKSGFDVYGMAISREGLKLTRKSISGRLIGKNTGL